jgi:hypothetical protein
MRVCVFLLGQGACMVVLSLMQELINVQTIQSSSVIATIIFSYYLGADSFTTAVHRNLTSMTFVEFSHGLALCCLIMAVLLGVTVTD